MNEFWIYLLFILGGFLIGGAFSLWKTNRAGAVILAVLGAMAAAGGILQFF